MFEDDNFIYSEELEEEDPSYYCSDTDNLDLSIIWEESSNDLRSHSSYRQGLNGDSRHLIDMAIPPISQHTEFIEEAGALQDGTSPRQRMSLKSVNTGELVTFSMHSDGDFTFESCSTLGLSTISGDGISTDDDDSWQGVRSFDGNEDDHDQTVLPTSRATSPNTSPEHGEVRKGEQAINIKEMSSFESPRTPTEIFRFEKQQAAESEKKASSSVTIQKPSADHASWSQIREPLRALNDDDIHVTPKRKNVISVIKSNSYKRIDFAGGLTTSEDRSSKRERILAKMKIVEGQVEEAKEILSALPPPQTKTPPQRSKSEGDYISRQRRKLARAHEKFKEATKKLSKLRH